MRIELDLGHVEPLYLDRLLKNFPSFTSCSILLSNNAQVKNGIRISARSETLVNGPIIMMSAGFVRSLPRGNEKILEVFHKLYKHNIQKNVWISTLPKAGNCYRLTESGISTYRDQRQQYVAFSKNTQFMRTIHSKGNSDQQRAKLMDLPQIKVPDSELLLFRGMETEFPCLTRNNSTGPEPQYDNIVSGFETFHCKKPFSLKYNGAVLPELKIAYETWGQLNQDASNAVIIHAGLSASSHAKSHPDNEQPGWWEKFVGPGCAIDTDKFFVICTNTLGGCYGTSGPSSINPLTGKEYGTTFPLISINDMVHAQFLLMDHLGIDRVHASVGSSLGGMCSLMSAALYPDRVGRLVSISSCAYSHPSSIAMRYLQRKCIMTDPNWKKGHYYHSAFPKLGMKLAREIATLTYRSGPEWDQRFGRNRIEENSDCPTLCPTFLIESYLEYQGESFSTKFDPNSLLYISKAMDLFDISEDFCTLQKGLGRIQCPVMVIGVQTDILFPIWQQRELAEVLQNAGNNSVTFYELNSMYGHDTFLLDLNGVGAGVKGFLETKQKETGWLNKHRKQNGEMADRRHF